MESAVAYKQGSQNRRLQVSELPERGRGLTGAPKSANKVPVGQFGIIKHSVKVVLTYGMSLVTPRILRVVL